VQFDLAQTQLKSASAKLGIGGYFPDCGKISGFWPQPMAGMLSSSGILAKNH
jgi:hypothetical protein